MAREGTRWTCERCGRSGVVEYEAGADVYGVVELLRRDHAAVSPECETDLGVIRVTPELTEAPR